MLEKLIARGEGVRAVLPENLETDSTEQGRPHEHTPRQGRFRDGQAEFVADRVEVPRQAGRNHDGGGRLGGHGTCAVGGVEDPDQAVDDARPGTGGAFGRRLISGYGAAEQQRITGGLAQRPLADRTTEGKEPAAVVAVGHGIDGGVDLVAQLAVGVDQKEGQEFVAALDIAVHGGGYDAKVPGDGAKGERSGTMQRQVLAAEPDDVRDGLGPGPFAGSLGLFLGGGCPGHEPSMTQRRAAVTNVSSALDLKSTQVHPEYREHCSRKSIIEQEASVAMYVVTGAGPIGWTIAEHLAGQGKNVRILTRSGSGPDHPLVEKLRVDVSDPVALGQILDGASAVFHCIHGSAYRAKAWAAELPEAERVVMDAAVAAGAVVVFPESLYSYSEPDKIITESSPREEAGGKRGIRTALLKARAAHPADTVSVVAGDYFGPRARLAHAGERMVPLVLSGKTVQVLGSADQPHSFTYVPDLAAAMVTAAQRPELWNSVLHAPTLPPLTMREIATAFATAAGLPAPKLSVVPGWLLRTLGLASTDMRELAEMLYQFERPFVMDSSASERLLGFGPTPLTEAAAATVAWWSLCTANTPQNAS